MRFLDMNGMSGKIPALPSHRSSFSHSAQRGHPDANSHAADFSMPAIEILRRHDRARDVSMEVDRTPLNTTFGGLACSQKIVLL
jgi:hypothetical protein